MRKVRLPSKLTFRIDCLWLQPSASFETVSMQPRETLFQTGNKLLQGSLCTFRQTEVWHDKELEYFGPSYHLRTLSQWELQSCNPHAVLRANMPLPLNFPIVQWGEYFTMKFIAILHCARINSPNVKDGLTLDVSLHFVKDFSVLQSTSAVAKVQKCDVSCKFWG